MEPIGDIPDALRRNYKIGMIHGIQLFMAMPEMQYRELHEAVTKLIEEKQNERSDS